jgi:hypothetical protein
MCWDSSFVIAVRYGLDGPGIESRWGARFSEPLQTGPRAHTSSWTIGTASLSPGKSGRGVEMTNHPPNSADVKQTVGYIPLLPLWAFMACSRVNFYLKRLLYRQGSVCPAHSESTLKQYVGTHYTIKYSTVSWPQRPQYACTKAVTPAHRTKPSRTSN